MLNVQAVDDWQKLGLLLLPFACNALVSFSHCLDFKLNLEAACCSSGEFLKMSLRVFFFFFKEPDTILMWTTSVVIKLRALNF